MPLTRSRAHSRTAPHALVPQDPARRRADSRYAAGMTVPSLAENGNENFAGVQRLLTPAIVQRSPDRFITSVHDSRRRCSAWSPQLGAAAIDTSHEATALASPFGRIWQRSNESV